MIDEEHLRRRIEMAGDKVPSMLRRKQGHDYTSRRMYMVTMVTEGRLPLFGKVVGDTRQPTGHDGAPRMVPSPLGEAVSRCWYDMERRCRELAVVALQMMPDHLHGILFVRERMERPLGALLNGFKAGCNKAFRTLCPAECAAAAQRQTQRAANHQDRHHDLLSVPGYNDRILLRARQLATWKRYLADNPRRLLVKRNHPEFFRVQRRIEWKGMAFSAIGNLFLLRSPLLLQVQCSRRLTPAQVGQRQAAALAACRQGAVLVSPSISPGEKAVMHAAFDGGFPLIVLKDNGFAPLQKPSGAAFDACARGQLLMLGPLGHDNRRTTISRSTCLSLNEVARRLCLMEGKTENEKGKTAAGKG